MENPENYISCCGYYCKTCKVYRTSYCKGCTLGYESGERDISKSKCKIKVCCYIEKKFSNCSECNEFLDCIHINKRFKPGTYQNKKSIEQLKYLKEKGNESFIEQANTWKNHYGKLK